MIRLTNVTINELHNHHTITSVNSVTLEGVGCQGVGKNYAEFENRNDLI